MTNHLFSSVFPPRPDSPENLMRKTVRRNAVAGNLPYPSTYARNILSGNSSIHHIPAGYAAFRNMTFYILSRKKNIYEKMFFLLIAVLLPVFAVAQDESKYLAGAVPMEEGKVVFTREIEVPGLSARQIYDGMLQWTSQRFRKDEAQENWGGILKEDPEKLAIDCIGQEYITFSKSAFSLDRTMIQYLLNIRCYPGKCFLRISTVSYIYPEGTANRRNAEDWITDKQALNKDKTKLTGIAKKFRIKTIDLTDELFQDAGQALELTPAGQSVLLQAAVKANRSQATAGGVPPAAYASAIQSSSANNAVNTEAGKTIRTAESTTVKTAEGTASNNRVSNTAIHPGIDPAGKSAAGISKNANSVQPSGIGSGQGQNLPGYTRIDVTDIPGNPFRILSRDRLTIAVGYNDPFNQTVMPAAWGGLGMIAGMPVTFCSVSQDSPYQIIEKADTYTIRFHREGQPRPWLILECKKETSLNVNYPAEPAPVYMYIGKIIAAYIEVN